MNSVDSLLEIPFSRRTMQERIEIKRIGRAMPVLGINQTITSGKRQFQRSFKMDLYNNTDWLCGCDKKHAFFCFPCLLFRGERAWSEIGIKDINHLSDRIKRHQATNVHITNVLQLTLLGNVNITEQLDSECRRNIALHIALCVK